MVGLPMSQSGLRGPKMIPNDQYNMFLIIWGHFGTIGTLFDHFTQTLNFPRKYKVLLGQSDLEQKLKFCVKWPKRVQVGPKWPQMVKNMLYWSSGIILGPLTPYLIFVIFFTLAKFLENRIYTEKRVNYNKQISRQNWVNQDQPTKNVCKPTHWV